MAGYADAGWAAAAGPHSAGSHPAGSHPAGPHPPAPPHQEELRELPRGRHSGARTDSEAG
jgi:hypothetical protein